MIDDARSGVREVAGGKIGVYTHTQSVAAQVWTVNHNLGFRPAVTLFTTGGVEYDASVVHLTDNTLQVHHVNATAGSARCA